MTSFAGGEEIPAFAGILLYFPTDLSSGKIGSHESGSLPILKYGHCNFGVEIKHNSAYFDTYKSKNMKQKKGSHLGTLIIYNFLFLYLP